MCVCVCSCTFVILTLAIDLFELCVGLTEGLEHLYEMIIRRRKLQKQKKKR